MSTKLSKFIIFLVLGALLMPSCSAIGGGQSAATPTPLPPVVADTQVVAEGRVVPRQYVSLSFKTGGQVTEVLVQEGDPIQAGQTIARLDDSAQLAAAVVNAEVEQLNARQALDLLDENSPVNRARAEQAVTDAQDAVRDAQRYLDNLKAGSRQTALDTAEADMIVLKDRLEKAQEEYNKHNRPKNSDSVARATYLSKLAEAQERYDAAVRLFNNLQGDPSQLDLAIAEANLTVAQAQLAINQQKLADLQEGADPDEQAAQARLKAADAGLAAAQAALSDSSLVAPFSGVVADLQLKAGEQVSPGQAVLTLADFSQWVVETDDLTEIEVPQVRVGQRVSVSADALPDLELSVTVESIGNVFEEKRGDITYTVRVVLDGLDERLRWGMTTVLTFAK